MPGQEKVALTLPEPVVLSPEASACLDALRALAALAVLFGHARAMFFADYQDLVPADLSPPVRAFYFLTGFSQEAVVVFFVLSGLLIGSSVFRSHAGGSWSWQRYAIDRASRLYIVLIPALLLGLLWDWLGMLLPVSARHYRDGFPQFAKLVPAAGFTVRAILGDLLFLQKYTGPPGSNDVVWSLFCEFWFYVFLPAVIGVLTAVRNASLRRALIPLALSALSFWILNGYWDPLAIWLLGVAIALTSRYWAFGPKRPVVASACTIATGLAFGAVLALTRLGSDLPGPLPGLAFALFLHCVIQTPPSFGAPFTRLARAFANFSYSLYMLHFPVLLLISCFFVQSAATRWRPDAPHQAAFFAICCLVLAYAYLIARVTEHRTSALRAWLQTAVLR